MLSDELFVCFYTLWQVIILMYNIPHTSTWFFIIYVFHMSQHLCFCRFFLFSIFFRIFFFISWWVSAFFTCFCMCFFFRKQARYSNKIKIFSIYLPGFCKLVFKSRSPDFAFFVSPRFLNIFELLSVCDVFILSDGQSFLALCWNSVPLAKS